MNSSDQLWRVTAAYFVAGILVAQDGVITHAAPILKWASNKQFAWFRAYCKQKGWKLEPYSEGDKYSLLRKVVQND